MLRPRLPLCANHLRRQGTRHSLNRQIPTRNYALQAQQSPSGHAQRIAVWAGSLGGATLVAAYFFWPDVSRSAPTYTDATLSSAYFTPVTVTFTEQCKDPNTCLMTLTVPREAIPPLGDAPFAPIWSIFIKDDDIQVERPYTPLEGIDGGGKMRLWVKRYPKGEVGRWLHSKRVGDKIEIRGPLKTWPWQEETWDEIIMVSGGTGITPFYQLLHFMLFSGKSSSWRTRFTLLHSSQTPGELPPAEILQPLLSYSSAHPDRLRVRLFVDEQDGSDSESVSIQDVRIGRIDKPAIHQVLYPTQEASWWQRLFHRSKSPLGADKKILFLVCGPEP
ncbi:uncharacterized protein PHACADRAFT_113420 [Phanerochaete carnosa HHB-10118-sp]|uniref:FAD-binding FR-type domain-containing protein n=1 Tax=Phanerochaete carnosa (strain HHB-10118-sp) TaxID=650164 RepID=K5X8D4_PHACS|nr:uncharacterized protein PHACADRAFT_113420 [Phanerochaete carnosa HHB-10118-sp]EKM59147.1 hypothetical protein PHACADRAFT_113420 [Phanerochaete carnosa HHB-10118-sp]